MLLSLLSKLRLTARQRWWLVAGFPTLILFWAGGCFVWNHFLNGPYLHDAGWYSAIIYHQGLLPRNPPSALSIPDYYGVHFSPLISLASLLSYVQPFDRVPYYVVFQGLIYAPLGIVMAILAEPTREVHWLKDGALVAVVSAAFALNGQVLCCLGYPHFEIFLSAGLCLLLAGLATGRARLAWIGLVIAACTREDGGFHAAGFVAAALACDLTHKPFPVPRRELMKMLTAGLLAGVLAFLAQKTFFQGANLFRHEYVGEPPFAHLNPETLRLRLATFLERSRFIWLAVAATVVAAAWLRDVRVLFGWGAELPWLFLNFFAAQQLKSMFSIYTGFPFVASILWIGAYSRVRTSQVERRTWLLPVACVSLCSTLGFYLSLPGPFKAIAKAATIPTSASYSRLSSFTRRLERDPDRYGTLLVDPGIASWTVERLPEHRRVFNLRDVVALDEFDGIAFFRHGLLASLIDRFVERSPYSKCGTIPTTDVWVCLRPESQLPPQFISKSFP